MFAKKSVHEPIDVFPRGSRRNTSLIVKGSIPGVITNDPTESLSKKQEKDIWIISVVDPPLPTKHCIHAKPG